MLLVYVFGVLVVAGRFVGGGAGSWVLLLELWVGVLGREGNCSSVYVVIKLLRDFI